MDVTNAAAGIISSDIRGTSARSSLTSVSPSTAVCYFAFYFDRPRAITGPDTQRVWHARYSGRSQGVGARAYLQKGLVQPDSAREVGYGTRGLRYLVRDSDFAIDHVSAAFAR